MLHVRNSRLHILRQFGIRSNSFCTLFYRNEGRLVQLPRSSWHNHWFLTRTGVYPHTEERENAEALPDLGNKGKRYALSERSAFSTANPQNMKLA